jgi:heptosyltransferase II
MKILFVKLGAIGDAVMALSLLPALEAAHPGAKLTWMCGRAIEPLLRLYPQLELVVVDEQALFSPNKAKALAALLGVQLRMFGRGFDLVLHGNADWRYRLLTLTVRAGERRGWDRDGARPWPVPGRYHGDEYVRLITLRDEPAPKMETLPPPMVVSEAIDRRLTGEGSLVVLAPGGAKNSLADDFRRRWPVDSYAQLARSLTAQGKRVVLVGAASDAWVRPAFAGVPVIDLIGQTTLAELLVVFARARLVVSHDTSSAHLPRLMGTPVVALFGPTIPAEKIPSDAPGRVIWGGAELPCRPCYDGKHYGRCTRNECMIGISVTQVLVAVAEVENELSRTAMISADKP